MSTFVWLLLNTIMINIEPIKSQTYSSTWNVKTIFPEPRNRMIAGFDEVTNNLWLLGGYIQPSEFTQISTSTVWVFNTTTDTLDDKTSIISIPQTCSNNAQSYDVLNRCIWMINPCAAYWNQLSVFNMSSITYIANYGQITIPQDGYQSCLTTIDIDDGYVIINGGYYTFTMTRILNLSDHQWIITNNMTHDRYWHACTILQYNYKLYSISDTVEWFDINNMRTGNWHLFNANLTKTTLAGHRVAVWDTDIFVVGGIQPYKNKVFIIQTLTETVINGPDLYRGITDSSAIAVYPNIHVFGGLNDYPEFNSHLTSQYQSLTIYTDSPTAAPSLSPTNFPSLYPTIAPSLYPTFNPTISTQYPSKSTTDSPTNSPTNAPSFAPSDSPTKCIYYQNKNESRYELTALPLEYEFIVDIINESTQLTPTAKILSYGSDVYRAGTFVQCDKSTTASVCFLPCYGNAQCRGTSVYPSSRIIEELIVICMEISSCQYMKIDLINTQITNFTLICGAQISCDSLKINITSEYDINIDIYCYDVDEQGLSCQGINIYVHSPTHEVTASITCLHYFSCNNMYINVNDVKFKTFKMIMYEYSKNVQIVYPGYDERDNNIHFICNVSTTMHFVQYDINEQTVQLGSKDNLPCQGIMIDCSKIKDHQPLNQCSMQYEQIESDAVISLNDNFNSISAHCYWIDANLLLQPKMLCVSSCQYDESSNNQNTFMSESTIIIFILFIFMCIIIIVVLLCIKVYKVNKKNQSHISDLIEISNAMVIVIGIG
eukprot:255243_1